MTTDTHPGTAAIQGPLWSERADDWAELMEPQMKPAFEAALDALEIGPATRLLDVGCGSGLALRLAADRGADVTGLDASEGLLAHARRRLPGAPLVEGEIEHLPFTDGSFDIVTGFNSFQCAARTMRGGRLPRSDRQAPASTTPRRPRAVRALRRRRDRPGLRRSRPRRRLDCRRDRRLELPEQADRDRGTDGLRPDRARDPARRRRGNARSN